MKGMKKGKGRNRIRDLDQEEHDAELQAARAEEEHTQRALAGLMRRQRRRNDEDVDEDLLDAAETAELAERGRIPAASRAGRNSAVFEDEKSLLAAEEDNERSVVLRNPVLANKFAQAGSRAEWQRALSRHGGDRGKQKELDDASAALRARALGLTEPVLRDLLDKQSVSRKGGADSYDPRSAQFQKVQMLRDLLEHEQKKLLSKDYEKATEMRQVLESREADPALTALAQQRLRNKYGDHFSLAEPTVIGNYVETRNALLQDMIGALARQFFRTSAEKETLVRLLGKSSFQELTFGMEEAMILKTRTLNLDFIMQIGTSPIREENGYPFLQFYDFVHTIDILFTKIQGLDAQLGERDPSDVTLKLIKEDVLADDNRPWVFHDVFPENTSRFVKLDGSDRVFDQLVGQSMTSDHIFDPNSRLLLPVTEAKDQPPGTFVATDVGGMDSAKVAAMLNKVRNMFPEKKDKFVRAKTTYELCCQEALFCAGSVMQLLLALNQGLFICESTVASTFQNGPTNGVAFDPRYPNNHINKSDPIPRGNFINAFRGAYVLPEKGHTSVLQPKYNQIQDYPLNFFGRILAQNPESWKKAEEVYGVKKSQLTVEGLLRVNAENPVTVHMHNGRKNGLLGGPIARYAYVVQDPAVLRKHMVRPNDELGFTIGEKKDSFHPVINTDNPAAQLEKKQPGMAINMTTLGDGKLFMPPPLHAKEIDFEADVKPMMEQLHMHPIHACPRLKKAFEDSGVGAALSLSLVRGLQKSLKERIRVQRRNRGFTDPLSFYESTKELENEPGLLGQKCDPRTHRMLYRDVNGKLIPPSEAFEFDPVSGKIFFNPAVADTECREKKEAPAELQTIAALFGTSGLKDAMKDYDVKKAAIDTYRLAMQKAESRRGQQEVNSLQNQFNQLQRKQEIMALRNQQQLANLERKLPSMVQPIAPPPPPTSAAAAAPVSSGDSMEVDWDSKVRPVSCPDSGACSQVDASKKLLGRFQQRPF